MRSGDLTLPALLKLYHSIPFAKGSHILLRARLMDIWGLGILLSIAAIFSAPQLSLQWRLLFLAIGNMLYHPALLINCPVEMEKRLALWETTSTGKA